MWVGGRGGGDFFLGGGVGERGWYKRKHLHISDMMLVWLRLHVLKIIPLLDLEIYEKI